MYCVRWYFLSSRRRIHRLLWLLRDMVQFDGVGRDGRAGFLDVDGCSVASETCGAVRETVLVEEDTYQASSLSAKYLR
jgi:hypothetical protein